MYICIPNWVHSPQTIGQKYEVLFDPPALEALITATMTRFEPIIGTCIAILAATLLLATQASSHSGATGVVRDRMEVMDGIAKAMKRIKAELDGAEPDKGAIARDAAAISKGGTAELLSLFPEGSAGPVSEARPEIWEDWDRFSSIAVDMSEAARRLEDLSVSGADQNDLVRGFGAITETCRTCHKDFRIKK